MIMMKGHPMDPAERRNDKVAAKRSWLLTSRFGGGLGRPGHTGWDGKKRAISGVGEQIFFGAALIPSQSPSLPVSPWLVARTEAETVERRPSSPFATKND
jgi:hypothetical protein